ncbi:hypothetical protein QF017_003383 [Pseudomonas laurylsulfatiphila]
MISSSLPGTVACVARGCNCISEQKHLTEMTVTMSGSALRADHKGNKKPAEIAFSGFFFEQSGRSEIFQPPHLVSRCFVGVALFKSRHYRANQLIGHYQLNLPFLDLFDLARLAYEWLAAIQGAELALAQHLPGAVIISADPTATSGEYSAFDHFDMAVGNKKAELVHGF